MSLEIALQNEAKRSAVLGAVLTGAAAFEKENTPTRRDLSDVTFNVGDVITMPSDINSPQFIAAPLQKGSEPVTRAICEVKAINGTVSYKPLFIGTLTKSVVDLATKQPVTVGGNIKDITTGKVFKSDIWKELVGKTLEVTNSKSVQYLRRGFNGQPDRQSETSVLSFNVK